MIVSPQWGTNSYWAWLQNLINNTRQILSPKTVPLSPTRPVVAGDWFPSPSTSFKIPRLIRSSLVLRVDIFLSMTVEGNIKPVMSMSSYLATLCKACNSEWKHDCLLLEDRPPTNEQYTQTCIFAPLILTMMTPTHKCDLHILKI